MKLAGFILTIVLIPNLLFAKGEGSLKNVIGINTLETTNNHIGIGVYYERFVAKNGKLSVVLPLSIGWEMGTIAKTTGALSLEPRTALFINPGIKFYPMGNSKFFTYSVGLSGFAHGGESTQIYGQVEVPSNGKGYDYHFQVAGILLNNYLNFKISKSLSFGLEVGFGPTFINNYKVKNEPLLVKGGAMVYQNLAFQVAYRF